MRPCLVCFPQTTQLSLGVAKGGLLSKPSRMVSSDTCSHVLRSCCNGNRIFFSLGSKGSLNLTVVLFHCGFNIVPDCWTFCFVCFASLTYVDTTTAENALHNFTSCLIVTCPLCLFEPFPLSGVTIYAVVMCRRGADSICWE